MKDLQDVSPEAYPGSSASIADVLGLAEAYFIAAKTLFRETKKGGLIAYAPAYLCALHSTELFLNAFLRHRGESAAAIRGRLHSLENKEFVSVLKLRKKTAQHLLEATNRREYLIVRYAPELTSNLAELTRLQATLDEVMRKVTAHIRSD
ncbi:hypothetical protein AADZ90_008345 [Aestuariibius sp. 2305UL40-4]|uniref:hypothetical protein n=1 Tax=Aestuariibius violaceus TaxID=3234132 RepID=UPI00345E7044